MSIQAVPSPELSPNMCLACHAHRATFWVSLNVDLLEGHAYLCGDCANGVTHAVGGLTSDRRYDLEEQVKTLTGEVEALTEALSASEGQTVRVVAVEEIIPYVKKAPGRPRAETVA
jgi:hypothetical protein